MSRTTPEITVYLKTFCGWSEGVRAILRQYGLPYEEKDVTQNPAFRLEMELLSGQSRAPCVRIDGHLLADVGGQEVEQWLNQNGYLRSDTREPAAPTDVPDNGVAQDAAALRRLPPAGKFRFPG